MNQESLGKAMALLQGIKNKMAERDELVAKLEVQLNREVQRNLAEEKGDAYPPFTSIDYPRYVDLVRSIRQAELRGDDTFLRRNVNLYIPYAKDWAAEMYNRFSPDVRKLIDQDLRVGR